MSEGAPGFSEQLAEKNRAMFARIAPRYDLANDVLSAGLHRLWRKRFLALCGVEPGMRCLDCASGTGDVAFALAAAGADVTGIDACAPMLDEANKKKGDARARFEVADVQALPFDNGAFDLVTVAFGIRNVADPRQALREMARVCKPGGRVAVLELGQPDGAFGALYRAYGTWLLPHLGGLVAGAKDPYTYLRDSAGAFTSGAAFLSWMSDVPDLANARDVPLFRGLAHVYLADVQGAVPSASMSTLDHDALKRPADDDDPVRGGAAWGR
jgi:demethylmenaquinone methyltransferase/2-methoxy-6-polyprenyl-1,4-benzoquinol methylase